jgi:hypothetical protein
VLCCTPSLQRKLKALIGNYTFLEAYERTGRILNVSVCPADTNEPARLLNYLTAPQVRRCIPAGTLQDLVDHGRMWNELWVLILHVERYEDWLARLHCCADQGCPSTEEVCC